MSVYIFTIFALSLFAIIETNITPYFKKQVSGKILLPVAWLLIVGQMALRWDMATDWDSYWKFFESFADWDSYHTGPPLFEKGYWILNILIKNLWNNYTFFLIIIEGTFYILLFRFFKFSTPYVILCILLYYGLDMGMTGSNRQLLALVLCLTGLKSLIEGNKLRFIGMVILAFFFHASALLFFIFLFLNINIPTSLIITIVGICMIIGQTKLPVVLFSSLSGISEYNAQKVESYVKSAEKALAQGSVSPFGIIKKIVLPAIFVWNRNKIIEKCKHYNYYLNGYLFGVAFYFLFYKSLLIMISRGSLYFNAMEPVLLSLQLTVMKDKKAKNIVLVILCLFSLISLFQSIRAYPEIFIPYKSIFSKE